MSVKGNSQRALNAKPQEAGPGQGQRDTDLGTRLGSGCLALQVPASQVWEGLPCGHGLGEDTSRAGELTCWENCRMCPPWASLEVWGTLDKP